MKVINHTVEIQRALRLDEGSVRHEGNFFFRAGSTAIKCLYVPNPQTKNRRK